MSENLLDAIFEIFANNVVEKKASGEVKARAYDHLMDEFISLVMLYYPDLNIKKTE